MPSFTMGSQRRVVPAGQVVRQFNESVTGQQILRQQAAIQANCPYTEMDLATDASVQAWNAAHPLCPPLGPTTATPLSTYSNLPPPPAPNQNVPIVYPQPGPSMSDYLFWGAVGAVGLGAAYLLFVKK